MGLEEKTREEKRKALLAKAREILWSGSIYESAFSTNVEAYHLAVDMRRKIERRNSDSNRRPMGTPKEGKSNLITFSIGRRN